MLDMHGVNGKRKLRSVKWRRGWRRRSGLVNGGNGAVSTEVEERRGNADASVSFVLSGIRTCGGEGGNKMMNVIEAVICASARNREWSMLGNTNVHASAAAERTTHDNDDDDDTMRMMGGAGSSLDNDGKSDGESDTSSAAPSLGDNGDSGGDGGGGGGDGGGGGGGGDSGGASSSGGHNMFEGGLTWFQVVIAMSTVTILTSILLGNSRSRRAKIDARYSAAAP